MHARALVAAAPLAILLVACATNAQVAPTTNTPATAAVVVESTPPPARTIRFGRPTDKVGEKYRSRETFRRSLVVHGETEIGTREIDRSDVHVQDATTEVLAEKNGLGTKMRVTFDEQEEQRVQNGDFRRIKSGVAGKTYIVERTASGLFITDPKGKTPPKKELAYIERQARNFGIDTGYREAISGQALAVGAQAPALAAYLGNTFARGVGARVELKDVSVTLEGTRQVDGEECGVFVVGLRLVIEHRAEIGVEVDEIELSGEMLIRTSDSSTVSTHFEGPLRGRVEIGAMTASVNGKFRSDTRTTGR